MHDGPPLAFLLLVGSCVPILAVRSLFRVIIRAKDGRVVNQVSSLTEQVEQLRHVSTGFDISFDKRLSEIELLARLAKLSDALRLGNGSSIQPGGMG
jgi:hypothetical protein